MNIEVKQWPESQEVMGNPDWFFVTSDGENDEYEILGSSAMARVIDEPSMKYQLDCLRNEIDHITEDSVKHNNSPMTVHGQFQSIVKKIDRILDGKEEYTTPNGWKTEEKVEEVSEKKIVIESMIITDEHHLLIDDESYITYQLLRLRLYIKHKIKKLPILAWKNLIGTERRRIK